MTPQGAIPLGRPMLPRWALPGGSNNLPTWEEGRADMTDPLINCRDPAFLFWSDGGEWRRQNPDWPDNGKAVPPPPLGNGPRYMDPMRHLMNTLHKDYKQAHCVREYEHCLTRCVNQNGNMNCSENLPTWCKLDPKQRTGTMTRASDCVLYVPPYGVAGPLANASRRLDFVRRHPYLLHLGGSPPSGNTKPKTLSQLRAATRESNRNRRKFRSSRSASRGSHQRQYGSHATSSLIRHTEEHAVVTEAAAGQRNEEHTLGPNVEVVGRIPPGGLREQAHERAIAPARVAPRADQVPHGFKLIPVAQARHGGHRKGTYGRPSPTPDALCCEGPVADLGKGSRTAPPEAW